MLSAGSSPGPSGRANPEGGSSSVAVVVGAVLSDSTDLDTLDGATQAFSHLPPTRNADPPAHPSNLRVPETFASRTLGGRHYPTMEFPAIRDLATTVRSTSLVPSPMAINGASR